MTAIQMRDRLVSVRLGQAKRSHAAPVQQQGPTIRSPDGLRSEHRGRRLPHPSASPLPRCQR